MPKPVPGEKHTKDDATSGMHKTTSKLSEEARPAVNKKPASTLSTASSISAVQATSTAADRRTRGHTRKDPTSVMPAEALRALLPSYHDAADWLNDNARRFSISDPTDIAQLARAGLAIFDKSYPISQGAGEPLHAILLIIQHQHSAVWSTNKRDQQDEPTPTPRQPAQVNSNTGTSNIQDDQHNQEDRINQLLTQLEDRLRKREIERDAQWRQERDERNYERERMMREVEKAAEHLREMKEELKGSKASAHSLIDTLTQALQEQAIQAASKEFAGAIEHKLKQQADRAEEAIEHQTRACALPEQIDTILASLGDEIT